MADTIGNLADELLRLSERVDERTATNSTATITLKRSLSFLSIRQALNTYPDTGESGDSYDVEIR